MHDTQRGWWLGLILPGGGQLVRGQWLAGLLALWAVPYLVLLALADAATHAPLPGQSLVAQALAAAEAMQTGPQPIWVIVLAIAVHLGCAWLARRPTQPSP